MIEVNDAINVESIAVAHTRLMRAYLDVLTHVEAMGVFARYEPRTPLKLFGFRKWSRLPSLFTVRYLVTLFSHSHFQARSNELRFAYVQLAQQLADVEQPKARTWLNETAASLETYSKTLDSWSSVKGIFSLTWPVGVGFYVAWAQTENLYSALLNLSLPRADLLLAVAMFPVVYLFLFLYSAFQYKRALLYPNETGLVRAANWDGPNVYQLEDELFRQVRRKKTREFPLDILCYMVATGMFGFVPIYLTLKAPRIDWLQIASGSFFLLCAIVMPLSLRRRQWR
jgi:hypothetical protein